ncbi:short-chain dehydrogenase [Paraburkholderia monticola]|uniref:Short-chain dehydrogenase n=1 Tax=Paraburkholderia monticola TaxID=1399968 RepID=A0A149PKH9_9BURK|nr:oxidoreductase [Paraburkholderia monticola]KXU85540.1 short-chain dehydrogenase [Paraburkholderia monticola]
MSDSNDSTLVWLITGCSTGFGRELASAVLRHGWRAVVTARDPAQIAALADAFPQQASAIRLDVTRPDDAAAAVARAETAFGRIDVLVNNAGYGYLAAVEEGEDEEVRAMFEANFFGAVNMIKAVLPSMRARRSGHIVNVTSVGGFIGNPASGYYAATKFALEGLSESLARETAELGIKVTAVEPGPFRTDWAGRSLKQTRKPIDDYASIAGKRRVQVVERSGKQPGDPVRAAEAIIAAVRSPTPPAHLVLGRSGLEMVRGKLARVAADLDTWEETTLWADAPAA